MRWFVEISQVGAKPEDHTSLCVEAPQWQPALQKARAIRGDNGALGNFSIELLDEGYRAIDPMTRTRYVVRRAPDDAKLTNGASASIPPGTADVKADAKPAAKAEPAKAEPVKAEPAKAEPVKAEPAKAEPAKAEKAAAPVSNTKADGAPSFSVITTREDDPTDAAPLTYREYAYAVAQGTSDDDARKLVLDRFEHVRASIAGSAAQFVNLAVFDHAFEGRPERRPLVTLTWREWKGKDPEIRHPLRDRGSAPPSAPAPAKIDGTPTVPIAQKAAPKAEAPKPEPVKEQPKAEPAKAAPKSEPPPRSEPAKAEPAKVAPKSEPPPRSEPAKAAPKSEPPARSEPAKATPAPAEKPAPRSEPAPSRPSNAPVAPAASAASASAASVAPPKPPKAKKRLTGDDLLTELFEAFGDLHFVRDTLEGAEFALARTLENIPSEVGLVSLFDMNTRQFIVVRQVGGPRSALCGRQPEKAPLAIGAMRKRHAIVVTDKEEAARAMDDRWRAIGVELTSIMTAPVELNGRYLGLIEIANPTDGRAYDEGDGNALTYIGQQLAELVAQRGVVVDPATIRGEEEEKPPPVSRVSSPGRISAPPKSGPGKKAR
jgi:hypothetical protein